MGEFLFKLIAWIKNARPPITKSEAILGSEQRLKRFQKLVEVEIALTMILIATTLFVGVFVFAWKFNMGVFKKIGQPSDAQLEVKNVSARVRLGAGFGPSVFINGQVVDIEKAFVGKPGKIHLTVGGQMRKEVFGYLPYWVLDKADEISTDLLTSVAYFGLDIGKDGNVVKTTSTGAPNEAWSRWQNDPKLANFLSKAKKNRIKVYVTVKSFNNSDIENLVKSDSAQSNFIANVLYLVNSKSLDGVNVDFEYVGEPEEKVRDGFSLLIKNLNRELKRQYPKSILTVATYVDAASSKQLHDVEMLAKNSDALVVMGYDFHTPNSDTAGPIAPLEGYGSSLTGYMSSYLEKVDPDKLILGVPYYGYDWPVLEGSANAPAVGNRSDVKIRSYADILESSINFQIKWDDSAQTPWYSYKDPQTGWTRVVHFENSRSLGIKYDYVNQKDLLGVGIWALGFDGTRSELLQLLADKFAN